MREIKFKGQKTSTKEWVYGSLIINTSGAHTITKITDNPVSKGILTNWCFGVIPETVCQYTGLNDEYGNEIYEGDFDENGYVVEYDESLAAFICVDKDSDEWYHLSDLHTEFEGMNIIGNIHQNRELLENNT